jgi:xanthine/CO dehydrogenase XdhC/CoxF family maturation factor
MDTEWPLFGWIDDIRPALFTAATRGEPMALATIRTLSGSSPRPAGSQMLFAGEEAAGYFSGGCVESDVAIHARAASAMAPAAPGSTSASSAAAAWRSWWSGWHPTSRR